MPRRAVAVVPLTAALLAGCGGSGDTTVAHVGGKGDHAEAARRGRRSTSAPSASAKARTFPDEKSAAFKPQRNQLLGLLVSRTELQPGCRSPRGESHAARSRQRLAAPASGEQEGGTGGDTFPRDSIVTQLLTEGIFAKVTRNVKAPTQAELSARRNQAMARSWRASARDQGALRARL